MESLNLNNLASSLPPSNLAKAEMDITDNFKAAALSLTTLYRSSKRTSKRAYNAGYAAACRDLLNMIQQGVSAGDSSGSDGQGVAIGHIMDYVEARLEAIRSREEEEDEDEEKERERAGGATGSGPTKPASAGTATAPVVAPKHPPATPAQIPSSTATARLKEMAAVTPPTPYTPSTFTNTSATPSPLNINRAVKSRLYAKDPSIISAPPSPFSFEPPTTTVLSPPTEFDVPVGSKRRHNIMALDSPTPTPTEGGPSTRRRTRSARGAALAASQEQNLMGDAMDVEEEGRERKRVARR
ncbi:hypothetical protein FOMPIDRAFT_162716 [Fomitopsis schrenkii]|uniref:Uncharacterized protein n=1 Tax=Fomitopsis schrenkii TaxID=2126942 RepID=S8DIK4_FOMSC|nr:hypothetical protein FOMPIDRAFT_162716 [Fomitopsis schrenkii]